MTHYNYNLFIQNYRMSHSINNYISLVFYLPIFLYCKVII